MPLLAERPPSGIALRTCFHKFAPRPPAYRDPRAASTLPPFARARRFLEHLHTLSGAEWDGVIARATPRTSAWQDAAGHAQAMFVTGARKAARDALAAEARRVISHVQSRLDSRVAFDPAFVPDPGAFVTAAALALVLRDLLPPELFEALYAPFTEPWRPGTSSR